MACAPAHGPQYSNKPSTTSCVVQPAPLDTESLRLNRLCDMLFKSIADTSVSCLVQRDSPDRAAASTDRFAHIAREAGTHTLLYLF